MVAMSSGQAEGSSLRVLGVSKDFPAPGNVAGRTAALQDVSLSLASGELVSLVGPSGCGKSTLLRLIAGLDSPSAGELWVGAERISGPNAERGLVFQDPNLFPWLTVRRNIQAGLVARGLLHQKRHEVDDFVRLVGLEDFADAFPHHLSGGMAQRAALARALINHPKVLLLDEPLGALDAFTRMRMQDEVLRLWQARRTTILLVTHDIDEAIYMSDRMVILTPSPGRIERTIVVAQERPRQRNSPEFLRLRSEILEFLHFAGNAAGSSLPSGGNAGESNSEPSGDATVEAPDPPAADHGAQSGTAAGASILRSRATAEDGPASGPARYWGSRSSSPARVAESFDAQVLVIGEGASHFLGARTLPVLSRRARP